MKYTDSLLRIHDFLPSSRANGPGSRAVIWLQGCTLSCPGCFNPATHNPHAGRLESIEKLFNQTDNLRGQIEGITISGGEPLQQLQPVANLLQRVRKETSLSIILFTGYRWDEIQKMPQAYSLLDSLDVLLAGRYQQENRIATGLLGSSNKTIHLLTPRYTQNDLERVPDAEIIITPAGELIYSGINPLQTRNPQDKL